MANNEYKLTVRRGPEEGQSFTLTESSITVGRDPTADIVLSDPEVSRQHARFTRTDAGYQLQDLGSTNGTFVDGRRLSGEVVSLEPGAVITMGSNVTVLYEAAVDPMATVVSPDLSFDFDEEEEAPAREDDMGTMIEAPQAVDDDLFGGYDDEVEEAALLEEPAPAYDSDSTSHDFEQPGGELPSFTFEDDDDDDDDFSFDFDQPSPVGGEERTMLDMEASDFSYASQEKADDALPSFDDSSDLPSFDDAPAYTPAGASPSGQKTPPPPPPPPPVQETDPNRRRNMIIAVIVVLLLCCCCSLVAGYFWLGDLIIEAMNQF